MSMTDILQSCQKIIKITKSLAFFEIFPPFFACVPKIIISQYFILITTLKNAPPQSHQRDVKWNFIFQNFALLRQVMNTKYEVDVILYFHKKIQFDPCTCVRALSKKLRFLVLLKGLPEIKIPPCSFGVQRETPSVLHFWKAC